MRNCTLFLLIEMLALLLFLLIHRSLSFETCITDNGDTVISLPHPINDSHQSPWINPRDASCVNEAFSYCDMIAYGHSQRIQIMGFQKSYDIYSQYQNVSLINATILWQAYLSIVPGYGCRESEIYLLRGKESFDISLNNTREWNDSIMERKVTVDTRFIANALRQSSVGFGFALENGATDVSAYVNCMSLEVCFSYLESQNSSLIQSRNILIGLAVVPSLLILGGINFMVTVYFLLRKKKRNASPQSQSQTLEKSDSIYISSWDKDSEVHIYGVTLGDIITNSIKGNIYLGRWQDKEVSCRYIRDQGDMSDEDVKMLVRLDHKNLVRFFGIFIQAPSNMYMVSDFSEMDDLKMVLSMDTLPADIRIETLCLWADDIAKGMSFLQENSIVHRNLSLKSIYIVKQEPRSMAKIGGFVRCKRLTGNEPLYQEDNNTANIRYDAPESLVDNLYTLSHDVWSYGIIVYEMFNRGKRFFGEKKKKNILALYRQNAVISVGEWEEKTPPFIISLIPMCLNRNHNERPRFKEIEACIYSAINQTDTDAIMEIGQDIVLEEM